MAKQLLKFQMGNAKLDKGIAHISLPAGHACPFADKCLAKVSRDGGKLQEGANTEFRCYSASMEVAFPSVRRARWYNFDLLKGKTTAEMAELIQESIPEHAYMVRIHVSGDFFSIAYFDAWIKVARQNPRKVFYAYTKSLPFWVKRAGVIPENFILNASLGGKADNLAQEHNLKTVKVVYSVKEAKQQGLQIDHDDSLAWKQTKSFALLVHGTMKAGSFASKAVSALRKLGIGSYSRT